MHLRKWSFALIILTMITFSVYITKLGHYQPYFTSFWYTLTQNPTSLIVLSSTILSVLAIVMVVLFKLFVDNLYSDEWDDLLHYLRYLVIDVIMNLAFIRGYLDLPLGLLIALGFMIRAMILLCKVRGGNIARFTTPKAYIRHFALLVFVLIITMFVFKAYANLVVEVTSPKSLLAFELLISIFLVFEFFTLFFIDTISLFFNSILSPLDPTIVYPSILPGDEPIITISIPNQYQIGKIQSGKNLELDELSDFDNPTDDSVNPLGSTGLNPDGGDDGDNGDNDTDDENVKIANFARLKAKEEELAQRKAIQAQQRADILSRQQAVPWYYRHFFSYRLIYATCGKIAQNQTMLTQIVKLIVNIVRTLIYAYILFGYYQLIIPIYIIRPFLSSVTKAVQGCNQLYQMALVSNNMGDLLRTLDLYDCSFLSQEEICSVCLVEFEDDAISAQSRLGEYSMESFPEYLKNKEGQWKRKCEKDKQHHRHRHHHHHHHHHNQHQQELGQSNSNSTPEISTSTDINTNNIPQDIHPETLYERYSIISLYNRFLGKKKILKEKLKIVQSEPQPVGYLSCGHYFHKECIREWLARDVRCPMCRQHTKTAFGKDAIHLKRKIDFEKEKRKNSKKDSKLAKELIFEHKDDFRGFRLENNNSKRHQHALLNSHTVKESQSIAGIGQNNGQNGHNIAEDEKTDQNSPKTIQNSTQNPSIPTTTTSPLASLTLRTGDTPSLSRQQSKSQQQDQSQKLDQILPQTPIKPLLQTSLSRGGSIQRDREPRIMSPIAEQQYSKIQNRLSQQNSITSPITSSLTSGLLGGDTTQLPSNLIPSSSLQSPVSTPGQTRPGARPHPLAQQRSLLSQQSSLLTPQQPLDTVSTVEPSSNSKDSQIDQDTVKTISNTGISSTGSPSTTITTTTTTTATGRLAQNLFSQPLSSSSSLLTSPVSPSPVTALGSASSSSSFGQVSPILPQKTSLLQQKSSITPNLTKKPSLLNQASSLLSFKSPFSPYGPVSKVTMSPDEIQLMSIFDQFVSKSIVLSDDSNNAPTVAATTPSGMTSSPIIGKSNKNNGAEMKKNAENCTNDDDDDQNDSEESPIILPFRQPVVENDDNQLFTPYQPYSSQPGYSRNYNPMRTMVIEKMEAEQQEFEWFRYQQEEQEEQEGQQQNYNLKNRQNFGQNQQQRQNQLQQRQDQDMSQSQPHGLHMGSNSSVYHSFHADIDPIDKNIDMNTRNINNLNKIDTNNESNKNKNGNNIDRNNKNDNNNNNNNNENENKNERLKQLAQKKALLLLQAQSDMDSLMTQRNALALASKRQLDEIQREEDEENAKLSLSMP